ESEGGSGEAARGDVLYFNDSISATYCCLASSAPRPLRAVQASHLARATMSLKLGFLAALSPSVACLNRPEILSSVGLSGRSGRRWASAWAASNWAFRSDMAGASGKRNGF